MGGQMDNIDKMVGIRIKTRRKELNLTQKDVYAATGISNGNLSEIERGNVLPSSTALVSLSKLLQTSIDWILTGEASIIDSNSPKISNIEYGLKLNESEELIIFMLRSLPLEEQVDVKNYLRAKVAKCEKSELSSTSNHGKNVMDGNSEIA